MKIAVLVSGGVDSSVALALLKSQGHDVTAFYLKIWLEDELAYLGECPWQEDLNYVTSVCTQLNVPIEIVNFQREYADRIISYTIEEIKAGRTPNPDMLCNNRIKFGAFLDLIDSSYEKVATGHYAQLEEKSGNFYLKTSPDEIKDQTYFLAHLSQKHLKRALFPIGHLIKDQVREFARQFDLPTQNRKDSQGLCFLGKIKFSDFVKHHIGDRVGPLIEYETGKVLGEHKGFWYYTIGQRKGSGLSGGPWYVVAKDSEQNIIFVSRDYYTQEKSRNTFQVGSLNWIVSKPESEEVSVKMRHGALQYKAKILIYDSHEASVILESRDQGIASGQFAVFYDGNYCLGTGVILK
ncbi:MAG TPA: tRNA 2-thiouridine(34) synthase MnmA [Candidatus Babeliales bacterium]|nr:tRNA 2-thiouridine(34) synthase MnmA [Candidatus Babeliales bacterium]